MKGYSAKQVKDSKKAKDLIASIGCPSESEFKAIIRSGMLKNCSVTPEDIDRCFKIFKNNVPTLKGHTVREEGRVVLVEMNVPRYILDKYKKVALDKWTYIFCHSF